MSKKDRLITAWLAADDDTRAGAVADVADTSLSYAARMGNELDEGELTDEDIEIARDDALVETYSERLADHPSAGGDANETADGPSTETQETTGAASPETGESAASAPGQPQQPTHVPPQQRHPPRLPQQPAGGSQSGGQPAPSQSQSRTPPNQLPTNGQESVSVDALQLLDGLLVTYEEEAHFDLQNLPPTATAAAVGKLFIIQQTRSRLRAMLQEGQGPHSP